MAHIYMYPIFLNVFNRKNAYGCQLEGFCVNSNQQVIIREEEKDIYSTLI